MKVETVTLFDTYDARKLSAHINMSTSNGDFMHTLADVLRKSLHEFGSTEMQNDARTLAGELSYAASVLSRN